MSCEARYCYLFDRRELEVRVETHQLAVVGGLLELSVTLTCIEDDLALELHCL